MQCLLKLATHAQLDDMFGNQLQLSNLVLQVTGCGCDYASVERVNKDHLHPTLSRLVRTPFFKYFKVNLYCDCAFWPDASRFYSAYMVFSMGGSRVLSKHIHLYCIVHA